MRVAVTCACRHVFMVDEDRVGGFVNCPRCGQATRVEGLRDPLWRLLQAGALLVCLVAAVLVAQAEGVWVGAAVGAGLAGLFWLLRLAL